MNSQTELSGLQSLAQSGCQKFVISSNSTSGKKPGQCPDLHNGDGLETSGKRTEQMLCSLPVGILSGETSSRIRLSLCLWHCALAGPWKSDAPSAAFSKKANSAPANASVSGTMRQEVPVLGRYAQRWENAAAIGL